MRVIIQRVKSSQVTVNDEIVGKIARGLNLLVGIADTDTDVEIDWMVRKCLDLRLFPDEEGEPARCGESSPRLGGSRHDGELANPKGGSLRCSDWRGDRWQKSVQEINGELLVISQFTLYGDCRKGRRPSFDRSAAPTLAKDLYNRFVAKLQETGLRVETGEFGAMMQVSIENDGPVTLLLEREAI